MGRASQPGRERYLKSQLRLQEAIPLGNLPRPSRGCMLPLMSWRPVRKLVGIGNVFLGTEIVDIAEYDLEIYEENPEDHEHHGSNWKPGARKIEGTVEGNLPIRKDLRLVTAEEYSLNFD